LRISVHRAIPQAQLFREQWNALVEQMERPEVFYTCEWAIAVEQAYRASMKPLLLVAHEGESLAGVAALATDNAEKQVSFLCGTTADYCDFICHPSRRAEFVAAVLAELATLRTPILRLANLPADSATSRVMKDAAGQHGYLVFSRPAYQCAQVALGCAAERQELKQSVVKRKAFRSYIKGLEKTAPVTVDHLKQWNAIQPNLTRFVEAHVARFLAGGRASNLASSERQNFLATLAELLSSAGWLVLTRLLVGAEPVAWNYGFQFAGSWFYYQPTFEARWRQYSPGFCLLTKMVEQACDDPEINLLDLGLGDEGYKERFANGFCQTLHATITNSQALRLRETVRYHAASAVKASPRLENWVRRLVGRPSAENAKV
jgi:CelD/BcsL family acetyltransferase involved in cellulose biosynthesis